MFFPSFLGFSGIICYLEFFYHTVLEIKKLTYKRLSACPLLYYSGLRAGLAFPPEGKFPIVQIHFCPSLLSVALPVPPRHRRSAWCNPGLRIALCFQVPTQPQHSPVTTPQAPIPPLRKGSIDYFWLL